jgi:anti-anti-sigma regulatory factor
MAISTVILKIDERQLIATLRDAARKLESGQGETSLDFSSVRRIHPSAVQALEDLARAADEKGVKVELRGVSVDVYKVLKLVKLTRRFLFEN